MRCGDQADVAPVGKSLFAFRAKTSISVTDLFTSRGPQAPVLEPTGDGLLAAPPSHAEAAGVEHFRQTPARTWPGRLASPKKMRLDQWLEPFHGAWTRFD
jgi:hypothetical protein